jgi:hypothetical protein
MQTKFTEDDLILYIYNELSGEKKFAVKLALEQDAELYTTYNRLLQVVNGLDTLSLDPDPTSVEIIIEHSHHEEHFH